MNITILDSPFYPIEADFLDSASIFFDSDSFLLRDRIYSFSFFNTLVLFFGDP
jgi:hypothetical protein